MWSGVGLGISDMSQTAMAANWARAAWEVFDDLKLLRCPRSLAPTLVTLPSMSLIPFAPFSGDVGWVCSRSIAAINHAS